MTLRAAYVSAALVALSACAPQHNPARGAQSAPRPAPADLSALPLKEMQKPRRFGFDGATYLIEARQRLSGSGRLPDGSTGGIDRLSHDIAVSREGRAFTADHADRAEAAHVAAAYCTALGGAHDDSQAAVFYPERWADANAEWLFPAWCPLKRGLE